MLLTVLQGQSYVLQVFASRFMILFSGNILF
jgi:hypothetical protein